MKTHLYARGSVHPSTIIIIVLTLLVIAAASFGAWAYLQYDEKRTDVDGQIATAVAEAKNEQAKEDEVKIQAAKENPYSQFVGPADYGRVTFEYPRNWSVYEATDVSGGSGDYEAYLNPLVVPPIERDARYALRVTIVDEAYDSVLEEYSGAIEEGVLTAKSFTVDKETGTRLDGSFDDDIRGAAVIFKIRDKTLTIQTDANTFKPYFEKIIQTIQFNR